MTIKILPGFHHKVSLDLDVAKNALNTSAIGGLDGVTSRALVVSIHNAMASAHYTFAKMLGVDDRIPKMLFGDIINHRFFDNRTVVDITKELDFVKGSINHPYLITAPPEQKSMAEMGIMISMWTLENRCEWIRTPSMTVAKTLEERHHGRV